ncbi:MAG: hypothetical protein AAGB22_05925, partial [Bacteroidota bacterium]
FTDLRPDRVITENFSFFKVDLNRDGKNDFILWLFKPLDPQRMAVSTTGNNQVLGGLRAGMTYPTLLSGRDSIGPNGSWVAGEDGFSPQSLQAASDRFTGVQEAYYGVRVEKNGRYHYGWIRVQLDANNDAIILKEYAFETTPNKPLRAGDRGTAPVVTDPVVDLSVFLLEPDLEQPFWQFVFRPALDESLVREYRLMFMESYLGSTFRLDMAQNVAAANYLAIRPTGNAVVGNFTKDVTDIAGRPIDPNKRYRAIVLSVASDKARIDRLSLFSQEWAFPRKKVVNKPREVSATVPYYGPVSAATESPVVPDRPTKQYPRVKPSQVRLYSAGKKIIFKTEVTEIDPISRINIYTPEGGLITGRPINEPEFDIDLGNLPEGIYKVRVNINNRLISRSIYIR